MFISAVKFDILTWGSMGIDTVFESASSGHLMNCSFWHLGTGLIFPSRRLLIGPSAALTGCLLL